MKILSLLFSLLLGAGGAPVLSPAMGQDREDVGRHGRREAAPEAFERWRRDRRGRGSTSETCRSRARLRRARSAARARLGHGVRRSQGANLLANEKAEAERSAALQQKAATPAPRETKRYFKVKVLDAGTLEAGPPTEAVVIRLEGIDTLRSRRDLQDEERQDMALRREGAGGADPLHPLAGRDLHGAARAPRANDFAARCSVMDQDLSTWLVRRGWATPQGSSEAELAKALDAAKTEKLGLWQAE